MALIKCGVRNVSYQERLIRFDIDTVEWRRCKQDFITTLQIVKGQTDVPRSRFFTAPFRMSTRAHLKFSKKRIELDKELVYNSLQCLELYRVSLTKQTQ